VPIKYKCKAFFLRKITVCVRGGVGGWGIISTNVILKQEMKVLMCLRDDEDNVRNVEVYD
jgi:hypothetical protein